MTMPTFLADRRVTTLRASLAAAPFHRARILRALALSSISGSSVPGASRRSVTVPTVHPRP
ncbi:hypothetical protein U1872_09910 [Sphingomonas sp. RB3P16]|uniref:hypothetical protein n=1 Tax=Parasphingomonas frigoris TaxID=3096163 RepID=UPI002FC9A5BD